MYGSRFEHSYIYQCRDKEGREYIRVEPPGRKRVKILISGPEEGGMLMANIITALRATKGWDFLYQEVHEFAGINFVMPPGLDDEDAMCIATFANDQECEEGCA